MAKPIKQVAKIPGRLAGEVLQAAGVVEKPSAPARPAATPVAPVTEAPKTAPKAAVSLGGEDQQAATTAQTRRRRAAGMQTSARGLTTTATTARKRLLGQ